MNEDLLEQTWGEVIWDWVDTRNYWLLLFTLPALLGCVGVGVFAFYQLSWSSARAEAACVEAGRQAQTAGRYRRAELAYQSVLHLTRKAGPEHLYKLAQCYSHFGRRVETVAILSALAPLDKSGYWPAHLFLAQALLISPDVSPQALRVAENHLLRLLKLQPQNLDAHQTLGQLYVSLGQWEDARKHLSAVVSARPEVALHLALTYRGLDDASAARTWASRAAKYFSTQAGQSVTNDTAIRLNWADALALMNDFGGAANVLETGLKRSGDPAYRPALGRLCLGWASTLAREQPAGVAQRLQVIQRGLEATPESLDLLRELALLSGAQGEGTEAARAQVKQLLADGRHAPLLQFCLGGVAWQAGDLAQARVHYEAALAAAPTVPDVANNLATVLALGPNPDLPRALTLVEALLKQQPANPFYRDTRGQILLRQGKPEAALLELEYALSQLPDKAATHAALAQVYAQLGLPEMVAEHRRRAGTNAPPAAR